MNEYIEKAQEKAGSQASLAKTLNISDRYIRLIREGKRGLPDDACIILADYIEVDPLKVIAASNLVTEKDERKRKIFESCFSRTSKAASFIVAALFIALISITSPNPANASQATVPVAEQFVLC